MSNTQVLIIGAGAAGLMAARTLANAGKKITVLEARNRCGGRIHTINEMGFKNAELGAEFVHGDLPVTLKLLNEAGITYYEAGGEMWQYKSGSFIKEEEQIEGWDMLFDKLGKLKKDVTIESFLQKEFPGENFAEMKKSVLSFVTGYDTADPDKASALALRNEWQNEDNGAQYRVREGYNTIINYLEEECKTNGGNIYLNSIVKEIYWQPGQIKAITVDGAIYKAAQVLIALPLGVLQASENEIGYINFIPPIPEQKKALDAMGFGAIIKVLLEFDEPFWEKIISKELSFLFSEEEIPTWWTQAPQHSPVLTGWLGGPAAAKKKDISDDEILQQALQSLSNIFKQDIGKLKDKLAAWHISNWTNDPFTCGSYAYDTIAAAESRRLLNNPVNNTIFFAGEYLYEGTVMGTVEAALTSGEEIATRIIGQ